jgi:hypothetical protein
MNRRSFLGGLLGAFSSASLAAAAPAQVAPVNQAEALPSEIARALDGADVAFSQRPKLYYNRQRQHRRRSRRRWPRRR